MPSALRQCALFSSLALILSACGGGSSSDQGRSADSPPLTVNTILTRNAGEPTHTEQSTLQVLGTALNTRELEDALAESDAQEQLLKAGGNLLASLAPNQIAPLSAYQSGEIAQKAVSVQQPVYRFYNAQTGTHFYTSSSTERDSVRTTLHYMSYEGEAFLASSQHSAGLSPVYRFFNTVNGVHFYTISTAERDLIQDRLPQFTLEGIAYYASPVGGSGLVPLYRFYLPRAGTHFYTASAVERQNVQDTLSTTFNFEGVSYYVLTGGDYCQQVNGITLQATPNACYLANAANQVNITLPQSADLAVGDTLRVSGLGAGGWRISQNTDQYVQTTLPGAQPFEWIPRGSNRNWTSVASSADGNKLVAVDGERIHTSGDAGVTWTARGSIRGWYRVASSFDGNNLVAVVYGGQIYTSSDAGENWTAHEQTRNWNAVASSYDGNKLVAVVDGGYIYASSDAGLSWTAHASSQSWQSVASSADGNRLIAGSLGSDLIYTSSDAGLNWTPRGVRGTWHSVASSADGNKLVAANFGNNIYTSGDAGLTWTPRDEYRQWRSVASSADGNKLLAIDGFNSQIFASNDTGLSWIARGSEYRNWAQFSFSADGNKLVAVVYGGQIYTSSDQATTYPGTTGFLQGAAGSVIELKYLGNNTFEVLRSSGTVSVGTKPK